MAKANEVIKAIKAHKGKIQVPVNSANGTMHVYVEKSDLIANLLSYGEQESGYSLYKMDDGSMTFGPA
jgi:copper chaperone CopZ